MKLNNMIIDGEIINVPNRELSWKFCEHMNAQKWPYELSLHIKRNNEYDSVWGNQLR